MGDGTGHGHTAPAASASGYAAPADAYASPAAEYAAPSYEAPAASYGAPSYEQEYAAPAGYDTGYGAPAAEGLDFDLSELTELLPLFVAVFAAIIVAQLVAPLFGALFGAKVSLFGGIFAPLGQIKADLINAILNPFGYALAACDPAGTTPCGNNLMVPGGRSLNLNNMNVIEMIEVANKP